MPALELQPSLRKLCVSVHLCDCESNYCGNGMVDDLPDCFLDLLWVLVALQGRSRDESSDEECGGSGADNLHSSTRPYQSAIPGAA